MQQYRTEAIMELNIRCQEGPSSVDLTFYFEKCQKHPCHETIVPVSFEVIAYFDICYSVGITRIEHFAEASVSC